MSTTRALAGLRPGCSSAAAAGVLGPPPGANCRPRLPRHRHRPRCDRWTYLQQAIDRQAEPAGAACWAIALGRVSKHDPVPKKCHAAPANRGSFPDREAEIESLRHEKHATCGLLVSPERKSATAPVSIWPRVASPRGEGAGLWALVPSATRRPVKKRPSPTRSSTTRAPVRSDRLPDADKHSAKGGDRRGGGSDRDGRLKVGLPLTD
jgi:hypothetical protein